MTNEFTDDMTRGAPKQVTDKQLINAAASLEGPAFTITEMVDLTPISGNRLRQRLQTLKDSGVVKSKKIGHQRLYYFADDGNR
jgi:predicted transcriptional regulator